jgi:hypothetical protein
MQFRDLTIAESFPLAYGQDLLKKQSEHFVSNALSEGNFENGYKNMPSNLPSTPENSPIIVNSKPPQLLIGTYLKHHWRTLLIVLIVGSVATFVYLKSKEKKSDRTKIPKNLY